MEARYGDGLPDWRYRGFARPAAKRGSDLDDEFQAEAEGRLAAEGLPWCFGEMNYPHWRRVPLFGGDTRSISYYVDGDRSSRRVALERLILCSRCPVFDRCHSLTMAKKSVNPSIATAEERENLLSALSYL